MENGKQITLIKKIMNIKNSKVSTGYITLGKDNMKTKLRPADSRYTLNEIVDPIYVYDEDGNYTCTIMDIYNIKE